MSWTQIFQHTMDTNISTCHGHKYFNMTWTQIFQHAMDTNISTCHGHKYFNMPWTQIFQRTQIDVDDVKLIKVFFLWLF